jgi:SAM-dependent methyltransferase
MAWHFMSVRTNLNDGRPKKLLHCAPETMVTKRFREISGVDYLSMDLTSPLAMVRMDLTALAVRDSSFDCIYCSHVLEHVRDDGQAMRELFRVLQPDGWALIQVPVSMGATFEDPLITDPAERQRVFWQSDHVRLYGLDIEERLRRAGFAVEVVCADHLADEEEIVRMGLRTTTNEPLLYCRRPRCDDDE